MSRSHDREVADARSRYLGAVRNLDVAMRAFSQADVPFDPGPRGDPVPWSREHVAVMIRCARAWAEVVERRREYDAIRREFTPPH